MDKKLRPYQEQYIKDIKTKVNKGDIFIIIAPKGVGKSKLINEQSR